MNPQLIKTVQRIIAGNPDFDIMILPQGRDGLSFQVILESKNESDKRKAEKLAEKLMKNVAKKLKDPYELNQGRTDAGRGAVQITYQFEFESKFSEKTLKDIFNRA